MIDDIQSRFLSKIRHWEIIKMMQSWVNAHNSFFHDQNRHITLTTAGWIKSAESDIIHVCRFGRFYWVVPSRALPCVCVALAMQNKRSIIEPFESFETLNHGSHGHEMCIFLIKKYCMYYYFSSNVDTQRVITKVVIVK